MGDTTSTYWEVEVADELADLDDDPGDDDGVSHPIENGRAGSARARTTATTCRRS
jgi:hypothetical protein